MNYFIVESATETGSHLKYLSCVNGQHWVTDIADASQFETSEMAEQLADDWQGFYDMKGHTRYVNVTDQWRN